MKKYGKKDDNQDGIVSALRQAGCSVTTLTSVGGGCPDLLIGLRVENFLLEVKDGEKFPSQRKLTPDQVTWHSQWRGQVAVVNNIDEAFKAVGL